ncbi:unnamed protein product [Didymodactylos carnosus]|uniref:TauD/TfdA-like domain-containing protein n=1 Tax=Didymodactylos carnosus TaxID=1234261 RepID=A0A814HPI5_9BILA|nr:unnamed protein product [Didymodactylos carnosus]CAF1026295.1 unnamed protein product [Didymodactylos carnosus]CAF3784126.1 unnamed protein product [Didymodactylos carnosus]CAF3794775.1 unnamed protein product [Didymodactylos carnosus]
MSTCGSATKLNIEILVPSIGAIIHDFDLSKPLTADEKTQLEQALYKHHVLVFRQQHLTPEQQRDFALQFGQAHIHPVYPHIPECPEVTVIEFGGTDIKPDSDIWHTDVTFSSNPPIIGMLYAKEIPKQGGGDTLWANMSQLYEQELSTGMQQFLEHLTAEHSLSKGFNSAIRPNSEQQLAQANQQYPSVQHPVIRQHPVTGKKCVFVNMIFTTRIIELNSIESDLVLNYLFSLINKRPELTCRWKWNENDVVLWDERSTQHYATADYWPQKRKMHRVAVITKDENEQGDGK